jgi:hypothetical protein
MSALADGSRPLAIMRQLLSAGTFRNAVMTIRDNQTGDVMPPEGDVPRAPPEEPPGVPRQHFEALARDSFNYFRSFDYDPERMRFVTTVIDRLTQRGIQVIVIFTPISAWREEGIFRAGHEDDYFLMRREAIAALAPMMNRQARTPCVGGSALQMWDFGGYQAPARTDPPAPTDTHTTPFYFEASHFKPRIGRALVRRLAGQSTEGGIFAAEEFGIPIDPTAVEAQEQALRARRAAWLTTPSGQQAAARFTEWAREDEPAPNTVRFYIDRDDWAALNSELPPLRNSLPRQLVGAPEPTCQSAVSREPRRL